MGTSSKRASARSKEKINHLTPRQFEILLRKLEENFPKFLININFNQRYETICGMISDQIVKWLRTKIGIKAQFFSGKYRGRGTEFSGGKRGTYHCWVEIEVQLTKHWIAKPFKVIIDGAYAQFFPSLTPKFIRDRMRLMIFINDSIAQKWYKGSQDEHYENDYPLRKEINLE